MFKGVESNWVKILKNDLLPNEVFEENITPKKELVFEFARITKLDNIKMLILGQDPYPTDGTAHGLAFSSLQKKTPPSLKNIFKCLNKQKLTNEPNTINDLTNWALQGVLLLNTSLTTETNVIGKHIKYWKKYIKFILCEINKYISKYNYKPVALLLGNHAHKYEPILSNFVIKKYAHPSPLQTKVKFYDCTYFNFTNEYLIKNGLLPINWETTTIYSDIRYKLNYNYDTIVAFTDGSCYPNKKCKEAVAGYSVHFPIGAYVHTDIYGSLDNTKEYATNIRAEGYAIYKTMKFCYKNTNWKKLIIITDSMFWIDMIYRYIPEWEFNNIDINEKKNADIIKKIYKIYKKLNNEKEVVLRHVKGHNKNKWSEFPYDSYEYFCYTNNDYVDSLAGYARNNLEIGQEIIEN